MVSDLTDSFVKLKEETRREPRKELVGKYNELYGVQKELSLALRKIFDMHRKLVSES